MWGCKWRCRVVDGFSTRSGAYRLLTTCPVPSPGEVAVQGNVACGIVVTGNSATGTNTVGTGTAPEHWWRFQAPTTGSYVFNSCGSSYDSWIHIYNRVGNNTRGSRVSTCDDCGPCGLRTVLTTLLVAGPYFVYVRFALYTATSGDPFASVAVD